MDGCINEGFLETSNVLSLQLDGSAYALRVLFKHTILRNYDFNRAPGASSALLQEGKTVTSVKYYLLKLSIVLKKQWCPPSTKKSAGPELTHTLIGLNLLPAGSSTHLCCGRNALE